MPKPTLYVFLLLPLLSGPSAFAEPLTSAQLERLAPLFGDYRGQWTTEASRSEDDDISRYDLGDSVLRLSHEAGAPTVTFFLDEAAATRNEPLDLLGYGCQSAVGEAADVTVAEPPDDKEEVHTLLEASFAFDWGRCPTRVWAFPTNRLNLEVAENAIDGEYVVRLALLHRLVPANEAYLKRDGEFHRVEIRPLPGGTHYRPKHEYCVVNEFGETETCYQRHSEVKHFVIPFPVFGASAVWWTSRDKVQIVEGQKAMYHEAVYRKREQ